MGTAHVENGRRVVQVLRGGQRITAVARSEPAGRQRRSVEWPPNTWNRGAAVDTGGRMAGSRHFGAAKIGQRQAINDSDRRPGRGQESSGE